MDAELCFRNLLRELHVASVAIHEDFDYTTQVNDIAILKTGIKQLYLLQAWSSPYSLFVLGEA